MAEAAGEGTLPPGQRIRLDFPRFGLGRFAKRYPRNPEALPLFVGGALAPRIDVTTALAQLSRVERIWDFHCVTTWSASGLAWSGFLFSDFHRLIALPLLARPEEARYVVLQGADGYRSILSIDDVLARDVMLADRLSGEPLTIAHGAPLRLVAPAHYGYKNVKHLVAIEYWPDRKRYRFPFPYPGLMDHPRARVAFEERARILPGWLARILYRPIIPVTVRNFKRAMQTRAVTTDQGRLE